MKAGDRVRCKPGYRRYSKDDNKPYGGAAYIEGKVYTVKYITKYSPPERSVVFFKETVGLGVYIDALEVYDGLLPSKSIPKFSL